VPTSSGATATDLIMAWQVWPVKRPTTDRKAPGKTPLLQAEHRAALAAVVEAGPKPYLDGVVRWRLVDLVQWLWTSVS
jgi:hypothetical protein